MGQKTLLPRLIAGGLVVLSLTGVALAAGQGSQGDPLITLSYLTEKGTPAILAQVDTLLDQRESALVSKLEQVVDTYAAAVAGGGTGGTSGGSACAYQVVTLRQGQVLTAAASCEILLRTGSAACVSDSAPGLVDMTGGGTLGGGSALSANHLYLATVEGRGVRATANATLMVRGSYTIR
ncbi:hypothetical protein D1159_16625 [Pseudoflavonifractor sp. 524-17]|uniref:hypothetical protein n=1 Tax=Pseudoflavonifractor sp. 524-17 TaxID=2304577 RepID=UPI00137B0FE8|nr:hypothetical protein [Pseudoflavonifractor sp. 524-17]NCE66154.1 hypothetical protein [Pseudoflavonifractor sp. 524-17]